MKNKKIIIIVVLVISIVSTIVVFMNATNDSNNRWEIGLTFEQIKEREPGCMNCGKYIVYKSAEGNSVLCVVHDTITLQVERVEEIPGAIATREGFESIEKGMSFVDVVKILGLPAYTSTYSGLYADDFIDADGTTYVICWDDFDSACVAYKFIK